MQQRTREKALSSLAVLLAVGAALGGCATTEKAREAESTFAIPTERDPATVEIGELAWDESGFAFIDGRTGESLSFEDVRARIHAVDVALVGEQHDQAPHHRLQARVIEAALDGDSAVGVGLEMVPWHLQEPLDRYRAGEIDEDGLAAALDWERTWGHDFELYRDIFAVSKKGGAKLFALNAPRPLVRAVAQKGVEGLSDEEKQQLPELNLDDAEHRAAIEGVFRNHHPPTGPEGEAAFARFYSAQVLWDESMADRTNAALADGVKRMVVLAGNGHVAGYRGIPQRIVRRRPDARLLTIVPLTVDEADDPKVVARHAVAEGLGDIIALPKPREVLSI